MRTVLELTRKIRTARELGSVVRTMKLLAAAEVHHYEKAVESLGESVGVLESALGIVLRLGPPLLREPPPPDSVAAVAFGSDHGLCGSFNEAVARAVRERRPRPLLVVGRRLLPALEDDGVEVAAALRSPGALSALAGGVQDLLLQLEAWRAAGRLERLVVLHNRPRPGGAFQTEATWLLPVDPEWLAGLARRPWTGPTLPACAQEPRLLLPALLRQHLFLALYRAQAESLAAENLARLRAMQSAERNLEERLEELTREYHRRRQDAVTEELLDVVAGYEALTGVTPGGEAAG